MQVLSSLAGEVQIVLIGLYGLMFLDHSSPGPRAPFCPTPTPFLPSPGKQGPWLLAQTGSFGDKACDGGMICPQDTVTV